MIVPDICFFCITYYLLISDQQHTIREIEIRENANLLTSEENDWHKNNRLKYGQLLAIHLLGNNVVIYSCTIEKVFKLQLGSLICIMYVKGAVRKGV